MMLGWTYGVSGVGAFFGFGSCFNEEAAEVGKV
jgi:hypothetical protein